MNKIRISLADDHAVPQAGLEALLNTEGDIQVVGTAGDEHAAVRQAALLGVQSSGECPTNLGTKFDCFHAENSIY